MSRQDKIEAILEDAKKFDDIDIDAFREELEYVDDVLIDYAYLCMVFGSPDY